jgi:hypothetical protein
VKQGRGEYGRCRDVGRMDLNQSPAFGNLSGGLFGRQQTNLVSMGGPKEVHVTVR